MVDNRIAGKIHTKINFKKTVSKGGSLGRFYTRLTMIDNEIDFRAKIKKSS